MATSTNGFPAVVDGSEVVSAYRDNVKDKVFAITGPSSGGLGAQTAIYLADAAPAMIILLGRTQSKCNDVLKEISSRSSQTKTLFVQCDLSSFASIRSATTKIMEDNSITHIDCLINNAGIMATPFRLTSEGIESQFASNHVGPFLLTNLLLPKILASSGGGRIVNVSSIGYALGEVRLSDWNFENGKSYEKWSAYGQSKTANILFSVELARKLGGRGLTTSALHPGRVHDTNLSNNVTPEDFTSLRELFEARDHTMKSVGEGTSTILVCALDPKLKDKNGSYLSDNEIEQTSDYSTNPELAHRLWQLSEELVGQKFEY